MHQFVDSPNGKMYAFRQFPGTNQLMASKGQNALGWPCEIWLCKSDLTGHFKAFTSPTTEGGHGSDVIVWVNDDLIYYAGISFRISEKKIIWQFDGKTSHLPLARANPVHERKLYVSVRGNEEPQYQSLRENSVMPEGRGWFWLDPSSRSKPNLNLVSNMKDLVQYYDGLWENAEATYIFQNPTDTKLFVVIYDRLVANEFAFVLNEKDGSVHSYLGRGSRGSMNNGHVLWIDDNTLFAGNQNPGLFNANGTLINRPLSGRTLRANHISVSSDRTFWVADIDPDHSISLFMFGSKHAITISGGIVYANPHPSFSRDGRYVFFQGKESPGDRVAVYQVDISFAMVQLKQMAEAETNSIEKRWTFNAPDKNTKERMRAVRSSADSGIPGIRIGAKVSADWQLRGEYYDGVVAEIRQEGRSVTIEYDDGGSIETLPFDHDRERTTTEERYPIQINDKVFANWESRGEYYAGTVTEVSPDLKSIKVQYDDDNSLETLPPGYIRIPWRNLNEQGRTSAKSLGFTELTWHEGSHPAAHLTPFDSLSTVEQNAARYLGLESQFVSFTPPISICFVSASYGVDVSKISPHADVTKLRDSNPTYLFFLFT
ncbi:MAG: tudor domain-containing protein, partial [Flavobacteriales bacterium]|nr:tudor domain-containing protein [Flavobacteriales bacterium]